MRLKRIDAHLMRISKYRRIANPSIYSGFTFLIFFICNQYMGQIFSWQIFLFDFILISNALDMRTIHRKACKLCTARVSLVLLLLTSLGRIWFSQSKCQASPLVIFLLLLSRIWFSQSKFQPSMLLCYYFYFCQVLAEFNQSVKPHLSIWCFYFWLWQFFWWIWFC